MPLLIVCNIKDGHLIVAEHFCDILRVFQNICGASNNSLII